MRIATAVADERVADGSATLYFCAKDACPQRLAEAEAFEVVVAAAASEGVRVAREH